MDYEKMTAPCGMGCFNCKMLEAKDDLALRQKAAEKFDLEFENAYCDSGCRATGGRCPFIGPDKVCALYQCSKEKNVTFCYECSDFPCDHLHPCADRAQEVVHNTKLFNLCLIKKMGLETWATQKSANVLKDYFTRNWALDRDSNVPSQLETT